MRKTLFVTAFAIVAGLCKCICLQAQVPDYKNPDVCIEKRVEDLLSRMTLKEKVLQLNQTRAGRNDNENNIGEVLSTIPSELGSLLYTGDNPVFRNKYQRKAVEESRLGVPMIFGYDVIHGFKTIYQIPLGQAATWNPGLIQSVCSIAAKEAWSCGLDWTFSPMVDIARDPRWGRVAEGYGEDPYLASAFSAASVKGYQGHGLADDGTIAACLKHFVGYGASLAGRDYMPAEISRQTLWDTYLPNFDAGVKAGAATVMSSFNTVAGIPATGNHYLLSEVLKGSWGFEGFVISDWDAVRQLINQGVAGDEREAADIAIKAGVDVDMADNVYGKYLEDLVLSGVVDEALVDEAVRRVLRVKFRMGLFEKPYRDTTVRCSLLGNTDYYPIVEKVAEESMVLLKNENRTLPLKQGTTVAVIGPIVDNNNAIMGRGLAHFDSSETVSVRDALEREFGDDIRFVYAPGCPVEKDDTTGFECAFQTAMESDMVLLCLGESHRWAGENASRSRIELPDIQEELVRRIHATGKPVAAIIAAARPIALGKIDQLIDAMLVIWQPGTRGAVSLAGILSGRLNPSGKLPVTFPYSSGQIPIYYNRRRSSREDQGLYQDIPSRPLYDFGHGLSYSEFEYSDITLSDNSIPVNGKVVASVTVKNVSDFDGQETVQWYISDPVCKIARPVKELKHFEKALIKAGESRTFTFEIDPMRDLSYIDEAGNPFIQEGLFEIIVGEVCRTISLTVTPN